MINNVSLLFSLVACVYVLFRAVKLDKTLPWFKPIAEPKPKPTKRPGVGQGMRR